MKQARPPWKHRLAQAVLMGVLTGFFSAWFRPGSVWFGIALGLAGGLAWFVLEPLIKPRRPFRDPVREESIAATEEAIRLAEAEIRAEAERR